jgi:hypothetical protein
MKARYAAIRKINSGRVSKSQRYRQTQTLWSVATYEEKRLVRGGHEATVTIFRNHSDSYISEVAHSLSSISSLDSLPTISSQLMLDDSTIAYRNSYISPSRGRRLDALAEWEYLPSVGGHEADWILVESTNANTSKSGIFGKENCSRDRGNLAFWPPETEKTSIQLAVSATLEADSQNDHRLLFSIFILSCVSLYQTPTDQELLGNQISPGDQAGCC